MSKKTKVKTTDKTKLHTVYKVNGKRVPGVTTILNNIGWSTNSLMRWAVREVQDGRDPFAVRDQAADWGTLAHAMIEEYLAERLGIEGRAVNRDLYSKEAIGVGSLWTYPTLI